MGNRALEEGIALVVANDGKILRQRWGIGKKGQMVHELEEAVMRERKETRSVLYLE